MSVVIYGRPDCAACERTKKFLDQPPKVPYEYVDIDEQPDKIAGLGIFALSIPIIIVDHGNEIDHWSGFRYEKLKALKATHGGIE